jgi:hypothetical protein
MIGSDGDAFAVSGCPGRHGWRVGRPLGAAGTYILPQRAKKVFPEKNLKKRRLLSEVSSLGLQAVLTAEAAGSAGFFGARPH